MGSQKPENHTSNSYKTVTKPYGKVELSLNNVLLPEVKLINTPSRLDGMPLELESNLRILGCELIQTAGILLKLPQVAMATGQVLFQRFYYSKSFVRHGMEITAMACVYLASKIEEALRRIRDVINVFHHIRQVNSQKPITPLILDQGYITLKNQVIKAERRILKELGFCVHVKHPHKLIVMYLQVLGCESNKNLMQLSWNYMNDALRSDVFMRYDPETVACACIYLSARYLRICLPKNPPWFVVFKVTEENLISICKTILQLYNKPKVNADELERKVDELKKNYMEAKQQARLAMSGNNTPNSTNSPMRNNHNDKGRSRSDSRSRSPSRTPKHKRSKTHRSSKKCKSAQKKSKKDSIHDRMLNEKNRSRSADRKTSKKHRRRSYSQSPSPNRHNSKHSRDKSRYRSRSRSPRSGSYDKYYSSSDKKARSKHRDYDDNRIRSRH